ncbi:MAG: NADPH:quinone oxidoreductase family protein [Telmatospirillum sp.]|nr:NADPH:quinone oxidoreductase family protein [Telmatospirillum sp.]MCZ8310300.1 NADPH:quinone oxidoreductase family protein [Magnetospirillum sp.]
MRAIIVDAYGPIENLRLGTMPDPVPVRDEVLVRTHATTVNYVDQLVITGKYQFLPKPPFVPGKGPAGIVIGLGPDAKRIKVGDRVLAMAEIGGYAELATVSESQCYVLPPKMSFPEASSMAVASDTAWFALNDRARYKVGDTVLVLGASGAVGIAAIQIAKAMGAFVMAGISNPDKIPLAKLAGADAIVDLARPDLRDGLRAQVHALTDGRGADIILDPLGGDVFDAAIRALAWCGRLVVIGFAAGRIPTLKVNYVLLKNIEVTGLQVSDYRKKRPEQVETCYRQLFDWFQAGKISPLPMTAYTFENFHEALAAIRDRTARGRVVLTHRTDTL